MSERRAPRPDDTDRASGCVLPSSFYERDTVTVARELLGAVVVSTAGGELTSGRIVETEAYLGAHDPGSHASTKGITKRNAVMHGPPGRAYVYFTYGNHHMLNVVTEPEGIAGAVLIRALEPLAGLDVMARRRAAGRHPAGRLSERDLTNGPGKLAAALGLGLADNGTPLDGSATLCVLAPEGDVGAIAASGRIGLSTGHEMELRFYLEGDRHVSKGRPGPRAPSRSRKEGRDR
jgi:DNA-3-methyladenine glycosylase